MNKTENVLPQSWVKNGTLIWHNNKLSGDPLYNTNMTI